MTTIDINQYPDTVAAFGGNEQRATVFLDRYALKNENGDPIEREPRELWERVSRAISDDEAGEERFYDLLQNWKFVPGGRILAGAGTESEVTYYNCFVIPVETKARRKDRASADDTVTFSDNVLREDVDQIRAMINKTKLIDQGSDSREAIFDTIGLMVDIMSRGGGVGINWSVLRPKGAHLKRVNGTTSGPVSWMDVASHAVGVVEQGGSRRGAAMFMLDDWHPDVEDFINAKRNFGVITNANVSVAVSDEFMDALQRDGDWELRFPDTDDPKYNSLWTGDLKGWEEAGGGIRVYRTVRARELWRSLADAAWASGEPGVVFLGRYNKQSTGAGEERIISVNPCGEQGLGPYSVCNLGAMNLDAYVKTDYHYKEKMSTHSFDWAAFQEDVRTATEFLDAIIDKTHYFIPENEAIQKRLRRIGLGVMGLADALIALKLRYGSKEAQEFTHKVFEVMKVESIRASTDLAVKNGPAPAWNKDMLQRPYFDSVRDTPMFRPTFKHGLRNIFLLTQAPTGTTSLLAGVNSGIEPYFAFEYTRKDRTGTHKMLAPAVAKYKNEAAKAGPEYVTSSDVSAAEHVYMQAAAQDSIDSSVSKTINAPNDHTVEEVEAAYLLAYETGCKGIAYFRDGCGRDQVLYKDGVPVKDDEALKDAKAQIEALGFEIADLYGELDSLVPYGIAFKRPTVLNGETHRVVTKAGTAYVTLNRDQHTGRPVEVFFNVGKAGSDLTAMAEALGRVASLALRHGATLGGVANQLDGVGGNGNFQKAIPAAISEALTAANKELAPTFYVSTGESKTITSDVGPERDQDELSTFTGPATTEKITDPQRADFCPECGNASLVREEGCAKCQICGFALC